MKKTPVLEFLINKVAGLQACNFIKKTPTQLFSVKYCEILRHYVQTAASGSKTKFVQSLQTSRVSESATFSSTAETSLLLCKFLEELHF